MPAIRAIETIYNGYRFRSRLEAKWAVYFDLLHIKYEYEPEGFVLENGVCYLPDFYLPKVEAYVEIKPTSINSYDLRRADEKLTELIKGKNKYGLLCIGDPADDNILLTGLLAYNHGYGILTESARFIFGAEIMDRHCFSYSTVFDIGIVVGERGQDELIEVAKPNGQTISTVQPFNKLCGFDRIPYEEQEHARQARFEYGECG